MKNTTIKLQGTVYTLALNLAAMIAFEEINDGKDVFDPEAFRAGKVKFLLSLFYAMLIANNEDKQVPELNTILHDTDPKVMSEIITKTAEIHRNTLLVGKSSPEAQKEDDPKND